MFKGYDEARRLGLSRDAEAAVRAAVAAQQAAAHAGARWLCFFSGNGPLQAVAVILKRLQHRSCLDEGQD